MTSHADHEEEALSCIIIITIDCMFGVVYVNACKYNVMFILHNRMLFMTIWHETTQLSMIVYEL